MRNSSRFGGGPSVFSCLCRWSTAPLQRSACLPRERICWPKAAAKRRTLIVRQTGRALRRKSDERNHALHFAFFRVGARSGPYGVLRAFAVLHRGIFSRAAKIASATRRNRAPGEHS